MDGDASPVNFSKQHHEPFDDAEPAINGENMLRARHDRFQRYGEMTAAHGFANTVRRIGLIFQFFPDDGDDPRQKSFARLADDLEHIRTRESMGPLKQVES